VLGPPVSPSLSPPLHKPSRVQIGFGMKQKNSTVAGTALLGSTTVLHRLFSIAPSGFGTKPEGNIVAGTGTPGSTRADKEVILGEVLAAAQCRQWAKLWRPFWM